MPGPFTKGDEFRMKKVFCLLLAAVLCCGALPVFAAADPWKDITLFIPDHVEDLQLTEMPEIPELDVPVLHCWMDTLGDGTTCPVVADPDGDFHVQFDTPVDSCEVDDYPVILDENGYGSIAAELTAMQMIIVTATVGGATYDFYTSGALMGAEIEEGGTTFYYDENGVCYWVDVTELNKDYFRSGYDGVLSSTMWERIVLEKVTTQGRKTVKKQEAVWYVSSVTEDYPAGCPLYRAGADYLNTEKHDLERYFITYNVVPQTPGGKTYKQEIPDRYAIYYTGHTYKCGDSNYVEDQILSGLYSDMKDIVPDMTLSKFEIDLGVGIKLQFKITYTSGTVTTYENGSGRYFGTDKWVKLRDATFYKGKKQLRRLDSFPSLRVKEK